MIVRAEPGACNCHAYAGSGRRTWARPDLTAIGARTARTPPTSPSTWRTRAQFGNNIMPSSAPQFGGSLSDEQLQQLGDLPGRLQGRRREPRGAMRVFLGVTGGSGAPYAARLLQALTAAGHEVGVCASTAGVQVLATELYGDASLAREEVLARFAGGARAA